MTLQIRLHVAFDGLVPLLSCFLIRSTIWNRTLQAQLITSLSCGSLGCHSFDPLRPTSHSCTECALSC